MSIKKIYLINQVIKYHWYLIFKIINISKVHKLQHTTICIIKQSIALLYILLINIYYKTYLSITKIIKNPKEFMSKFKLWINFKNIVQNLKFKK